MIIPESLKLNKFRVVTIPKNRSYFDRFGFRANPETAYSRDEEMPSGNKTDVLQQMLKHYEKEAEKSE